MVPTTLRSIEHPLSSLQDHRFLPILKNNILTKERFSDSESSSISDIFEISTRDDHPPFVYSAGNLEVYTSANTSYPMEQTKESEVPIHDIPSVYLNHIANALGFTFQGRRFQFAEENSPGKGNYNTKTRTIKELAKVIHDSGTLPDLQMGIARNKLTSDSQPLSTTRFIQAPGFRNDFYSNLVCWSPITNNIVFGIAGFAYCWDSSSHNIREIILHDYDIITCISCSTKDPMVIGTAAGRLILLSQLDHYHIATEYGTDGGSIHAVTWFKDNKRFIASDNTGDVLLMEIVHHLGTVSLKMVYKFKVHQQLVCGIAINSDETQLAFGGNDNIVSVWDMKQSPILKFILPHNAAVKAIAFCPWAKSLLVTGGGARDRTIRFWHASTGTMVNSFFADSQVSSLVWSLSTKQLVATFGFGHNKSIISIYSYPEMIEKNHVHANPETRALSSSLSADGSSICVACNDSTIRLYKLWPKNHLFHLRQNSKTFGSSLIDLQEDVIGDKNIIR